LGRVSFISVLAGLVTAYGTFAVVASIAGAILDALDVHTEFRSNDWTGSGAVAAVVTAIVLLVAYVFGGYVAGRMGRRAAVTHGLCVFVGSLIIAAVVSGVVAALADDHRLRGNLRSVGIPTTTDQVTGVAVAALIVSLAAMLVGSVIGAVQGERWHTKLARRAADPDIGPAADLRRRASAEEDARRGRLDGDDIIRLESPADADAATRTADNATDDDRIDTPAGRDPAHSRRS
jgi:hypothetical protein